MYSASSFQRKKLELLHTPNKTILISLLITVMNLENNQKESKETRMEDPFSHESCQVLKMQ